MAFFSRLFGKLFPPKPLSPLDDQAWREIRAAYPIFRRLRPSEAEDLLAISREFLATKYFEGVQGLELTDHMAHVIALFACLPICNLGLSWYDDWNNIFVAPAAFIDRQRDYGPGGVVTEYDGDLSGEVMELGPVVLSWDDVRRAGQGRAYNVVIHEMAHKLDGRNGLDLDGMPSLPKGERQVWQSSLDAAYREFTEMVAKAERGRAAAVRSQLAQLPIDDYAAESQPEFFAVLCESFFERPLRVKNQWPELYKCLADFFKLDPAAWI